MRLVRWAVALALLAPAAQAAAWEVLYRADTQAPASAFERGLLPGGGDQGNVLAHVSGQSCSVPSRNGSLYLGVTDSALTARLAATGSAFPGELAFVYHIVPDVDAPDGTAMFEALGGLEDVERRQFDLGLDLRVRTAVDRLIRSPTTQGQHFTMRVPPRTIQSVDIFERSATGAWQFVHNEPNPRFERPDRVGARRVFTDRMIANLAPIDTFVYAGSGANVTTSCLANCGAAAQLAARTTSEAMQCSVEAVFLPGNRYQQVLDIILD